MQLHLFKVRDVRHCKVVKMLSHLCLLIPLGVAQLKVLYSLHCVPLDTTVLQD